MDREKRNLYMRGWTKKNPTYINEYMKKYHHTLNGKYIQYKRRAKWSEIKWELSKEQFTTLWNKPCYYCGSDIKTIGIDRKDNLLGYNLQNCVSCCTWCNRAKMTISGNDFIAHCQKVADFQNK